MEAHWPGLVRNPSGEKSMDEFAIGSLSLIDELTKHGLIDEYQLGIHPAIALDGLPLFKNIPEQMVLKLTKTKTFKAGQVLYYERIGS